MKLTRCLVWVMCSVGLIGCSVKESDPSPEGEARFYREFPAVACEAMACPDDANAIRVLTCLVAKREPSITPEYGAVIFADLCAQARASDPAGAAGPYRNFEGCVAYVGGWFDNNPYFTYHDYWEFLGSPIAGPLVDECR